jgi:hypothetical protein
MFALSDEALAYVKELKTEQNMENPAIVVFEKTYSS